MSEESTTPDLVELNRQAIEAVGRRDFDAAMTAYGPESVWDTSALGLGTYRGVEVIRGSFEEWTAMYEDFAVEIEENLDLGSGVMLSVTRQRGRMAGSTGYVEFLYASVTEWADGVIERVTPHTDIDEARAAAERLAAERAEAVSAHLDLVRTIYAAWERGDYSAVSWVHPEMEYTIADGPSPGTWMGVGGMVEGFRDVLAAWEDWGVVANDYRALPGDRVLVSFSCTGRGKTSGVELAQLHVKGATLFEVDDGKVTRIVQYFERDRALADLGLAE